MCAVGKPAEEGEKPERLTVENIQASLDAIEAINDEAQSGQTIPERDSGLEEDDADDTTPSKTQGV